MGVLVKGKVQDSGRVYERIRASHVDGHGFICYRGLL